MGLYIPGPCKNKWTYGDGISISSGKELDALAELFGIRRKKYFFIFRESDKSLRKRCLWLVRELNKSSQLEYMRQHDLIMASMKTTQKVKDENKDFGGNKNE